jgi:transcriptional regulator with XRE-family HTH domain
VTLRIGRRYEGRSRLLGERVRARRENLGLTQQQVVWRLAGAALPTPDRILSSVERGGGIDAEVLPQLAMALECTITYLVGLTDNPDQWEPDDPAQLL